MFIEEIDEIKQQIKLIKKVQQKADSWDIYIDKQLEHLVIEYQFDFEQISKMFIALTTDSAKKKINKKKVQQRWNFLHNKRKQEFLKSEEELRMDRVSISIQKNQDPKLSMNLDDLINQLPIKRKQNNFLKIQEHEILNSSFISDKGEVMKPSTFNVLKDSVRGVKDIKQREVQNKVKELEFMEQLEKLTQDQDEEMFKHPLVFRAQFKSHKDFIIERQVLTNDYAKQILSHRVDIKNVGPPLSADSFQIDNYVSKFALSNNNLQEGEEEKKIQVPIKDSTTETEKSEKSESEQDQDKEHYNKDQVYKKNEFENEINQEKAFKMAQKGVLSIDDAVEKFENMRKNIKVQNFFEQKEDQISISTMQKLILEKKIQNEETKLEIKQLQKQNNRYNQPQEEEEEDQEIQIHQTKLESQNQNELKQKQDNKNKLDNNQKNFGNQLKEENDNLSSDDENQFLEKQRKNYKKITNQNEQNSQKISNNKAQVKNEVSEQQKQKLMKQFASRAGNNKGEDEDDEDENENENEQSDNLKKDTILNQKEKLEQLKITEEELKIQESLLIMSKKKEEERQRDLEKIEQIGKKFDLMQQEQKKKKLEQEQIKQEQEKKIKQEERLQEEIRKREIVQKILNEADEKQQREVQELNTSLIDEQIHLFESEIKSADLNSLIGCMFNNNISYLQNIPLLPDQILKKFQDFSSFAISREGITHRYQILIFPFIENREFMQEFLAFFLRNSYFKIPPTQEEFVFEQQNQNLQQIKQQQYIRLSSHGFPFCLVSFFIGSFSRSIKDECDTYLSQYIQQINTLKHEISINIMKKCLFLFFDTNIGRGSDTLQKKLDLQIGQFISPNLIKKVNKQQFFCNEHTKLSEIMIDHITSMELAERMFAKTFTFHGICPYNQSQNQNNKKSILSNFYEQNILIIREYAEIVQRKAFIKDQDNNTQTQNSSTQFSDLQSITEQNISQTELSQIKPQQQINDVIQYLMQQLERKGLQLLGLKTVYFNEKIYDEFNSFVNDNHFKINKNNFNKPQIVMAVGGINSFQKLKKIIGSDNIQYAKKMQQNSINAIFYSKSEDTIQYGQDKLISQKLFSYFFGGRLDKINNIEQLNQIKQGGNFSFNKVKQHNPIFFLNLDPILTSVLLLSQKIPPMKYGKVLNLLQKRGFSIIELASFSDHDIENQIYQKKDLIDEFKKIQLENFQFSDSQQTQKHCVNLALKIMGPNIKSAKQKIFNKILNYNPLIDSAKNTIIHLQILKDQNQDSFFDKMIFQNPYHGQQDQNSQFTAYKNFQYFIVVLPFLTQCIKQINIESFCQKYGFENIGMKIKLLRLDFREGAKDNFRQLLSDSINVNKQFKKRQEFINFCRTVANSIIEDQFFIAFFRLQDENVEEEKKQKLIQQIKNEPIFANSNLSISQITIQAIGGKKYNEVSLQENQLPTEYFEALFFDSPLEMVKKLAQNLEMILYDDTSLKSSFIYDLQNQSSQQNKSLIVINQDILNNFPLSNFIRKLESDELKIKQLIKCEMSFIFQQLICENLTKRFGINEDVQDQTGKIQKLKFMIEKLQEQFEKQSFWVLEVEKENSVFLTKKAISDISLKIANLKQHAIGQQPDEISEYQLEIGLYCCLNQHNLEQEIEAFYDMRENYFNNFNPGLSQVEIKQNNLFKTFLICQINDLVEQLKLSDLIKKLKDLKFRVDDYCLVNSFTKDQIEYLTQQFIPKHDKKYLVIYLFQNQTLYQKQFQQEKYFFNQNLNQSVYIMVDLQSKNVNSLSDIFGSFRISDQGEFVSVIGGQLFGKNQNFRIYTDFQEQVSNLRYFAFKNK